MRHAATATNDRRLFRDTHTSFARMAASACSAQFSFHKVALRSCPIIAAAWMLTFTAAAQPVILTPANYADYVTGFNANNSPPYDGTIADTAVWNWMVANVPLFNCPDKQLEGIYYFRWWTFRKHIHQTPHGYVVTEFLPPVRHAGPFNTISCALGHHIAEGTWLRNRKYIDDDIRFWFRSGPNGGPARHFHKYSSWAAAAIWQRYLATLDRAFVIRLLDDLIADYEQWEAERKSPNGLYWQFDVADGMEESISGSRTQKHTRPSISSYMAANARAIHDIAVLAGRKDVAQRFATKADELQSRIQADLWDADAQFYKVRRESGEFSDAREAIGFIPWMFDLAKPEQAVAWQQIKEPTGFFAPCGLTTAERQHRDFRTHGTGTCEWDGAVWPFATSQTLNGLMNVLHGPPQRYVERRDFFQALLTYSRSHRQHGKPYLGEYHDEITGNWLIEGAKAARSRDYNHSTFCDLIIRGICGVVPRAEDSIVVDPLLPLDTWDWFCLDGIPYHGHNVTILWDRTGAQYQRDAGLTIFVDGNVVARTPTLGRLTARVGTSTVERDK